MRDEQKNIIYLLVGLIIGMVVTSIIAMPGNKQPEYRLIEDNAIETAISIEQGNNLTLINVNRYEDGGGLWVTTYDGKGVPESVKIESTKETEND